MMKAGKALNERKTEIRVQFKPPTAPIHGEAENMRNELVVCDIMTESQRSLKTCGWTLFFQPSCVARKLARQQACLVIRGSVVDV